MPSLESIHEDSDVSDCFSPGVSERLRQSFARPQHWVETSIGAAAGRAQALLREHVVRTLDRARSARDLRALLVKGEALARDVYPEPWMRSMSERLQA